MSSVCVILRVRLNQRSQRAPVSLIIKTIPSRIAYSILVLQYHLLYKGNNVVFVSQVLCTGNVLFAGQALGLIVAGKSVVFFNPFWQFSKKMIQIRE